MSSTHPPPSSANERAKTKAEDKKTADKKTTTRKKELVLLTCVASGNGAVQFQKWTDAAIEPMLLEVVADGMGVGRSLLVDKVRDLMAEVLRDGLPRFLGVDGAEEGEYVFHPRPKALLMVGDPIFIEMKVEKTVGFMPRIQTPDA